MPVIHEFLVQKPGENKQERFYFQLGTDHLGQAQSDGTIRLVPRVHVFSTSAVYRWINREGYYVVSNTKMARYPDSRKPQDTHDFRDRGNPDLKINPNPNALKRVER